MVVFAQCACVQHLHWSHFICRKELQKIKLHNIYLLYTYPITVTQKYSDCTYTQKVPARLTYPSYVLTCIAAFTLEVVLDFSTFTTSCFAYIFTLMLAITHIVALTLP